MKNKLFIIIIGVILLIFLGYFLKIILKGEKIAKPADKIISNTSLDGNKAVNISQKQALSGVRALPEVAEYEAMLKNAGKKAEVEAEDGGDEWNVHVFEIVKNDDGSSHTATFGWYSVNKKTGAVEKEI